MFDRWSTDEQQRCVGPFKNCSDRIPQGSAGFAQSNQLDVLPKLMNQQLAPMFECQLLQQQLPSQQQYAGLATAQLQSNRSSGSQQQFRTNLPHSLQRGMMGIQQQQSNHRLFWEHKIHRPKCTTMCVCFFYLIELRTIAHCQTAIKVCQFVQQLVNHDHMCLLYYLRNWAWF